MEGKTVVLSVLIMSLLMVQIQVEARSCCPNDTARNVYNVCRFAGGSRLYCQSLSGCTNVNGNCPPNFPKESLGQSGESTANEYCKFGCASSVCGALITLQNSDASEIMNGVVEQCTKACSTFCTKGSKPALETA